MANLKPNKHEQRTKETRELLLQAAEKVFVRDGYEKSDLLEIAELANRTKGAIYGQFKSKEELFLALVESHARKRRDVMRELLLESNSIDGNLAALRKHYVRLAADNTFGILLLEFRLYTIRHPDVRNRLASVYKSIVPRNEEVIYTALLGSPKRGKNQIKRSTAMHTAFAMLFALQIERKFEPALFDETSTKTIACRVFDALFDPSLKG
jgi:AcrR family transcriptional regulator